MRRNFFILIFLFFIFSILNANPVKNEIELQNFRNKVDKVIKEELKNDYKKEYLKRKNNLKKIEADGEIAFEDEDFIFQFEDNALILASKKLKSIPNTAITQEFDKNGNFLHIFSITSIDENFFLHRCFDTNFNLVIDTYVTNGKCIKKGYYNNKQLAYITEGELVKNLNLLQNGKYIEYYKNGKIKVQGNYKAGRRDGEFKTFLKNGKSAGSVIYKDGKIIKSTLIKTMKDNASFSLITDINYILDTSHTIKKVDFENGLLRTYFIFNKNGLLDGNSIEYYEEGNIESLVPYKNDVVESLVITYYENGNIKEEVNYKNNKMNGEAKSYDENGKLNGKTIFKDDVKLEEEVHKENEILKNTFKNGELVKQDICSPNGTLKERRVLNGDEMEYSTFYQNGNVKQKILAKDKVIIKEQLYARNGNIMLNSFFSTDGKPVTEVFEYYPNGKMKTKARYIDGELNGELIIYFENGNIKEKTFTIGKKLNGDAFEYYPSGKLRNKSFFKDGKREGESLTYYENGNLKKKILYKNGVRNGEAAEYYESGIIKQKAYFINDKLEKEDLYYDEKGNLTKTEIYKNGIKQ
ncbi:toxin-antitoxin system YwqK family antitoxin [Fusobacterium nucleatum]|uniref:toxin-antitoxin system YwqK family antitoxin n=1 Tax=Fusobacterium nucleatum TaxID=851 RepID=UPI002360B44A|nr:toxin-antitoxin system YwqK family antitoxin [Fusobacterium nucleatum]WDD89342.1 toxin-antitoxin system YwqK family antitoxin [Fusobacterium nucleatum]